MTESDIAMSQQITNLWNETHRIVEMFDEINGRLKTVEREIRGLSADVRDLERSKKNA